MVENVKNKTFRKRQFKEITRVSVSSASKPPVNIKEIEDDPPLCGKTEYGGKVKDTALSKHQQRQLASAQMQTMLKETAPAALQVIIDIMNDPSVKDELKLKAAQDIMDRAVGKPKQTVDNELKGGIYIKLSPALEEYSE